MMGEGLEKHITQEGCAEKAGMVKSVAMGAVCRSLAMVTERWGRLSLGEFTCPKQWPTISKAEFTQEGFPVFGANGIIGRYSRYNHEKPAIVVTCRGATCGEVSMTPPMSYITGNAMPLTILIQAKLIRSSYSMHSSTVDYLTLFLDQLNLRSLEKTSRQFASISPRFPNSARLPRSSQLGIGRLS